MTTEPGTTTEERLSWLQGAYEQLDERQGDFTRILEGMRADVNERLLAVERGQTALRTEVHERLLAMQAEMHTRLMEFERKQEALREDMSARLEAQRADMLQQFAAMRAEFNSRLNSNQVYQGAMSAAIIGGLIALFVSFSGA